MAEQTGPVERWWLDRQGAWYRGRVFTVDPVTLAETVVYQTHHYQRRQDAVYDVLLWLHYHRGHKHPGDANPVKGRVPRGNK